MPVVVTETKHQQRLALYNQGLSDREIAEAVGMSEDGIRQWRKRWGLKPNYDVQVSVPMEGGADGKPMPADAAVYGVSDDIC